MATYATRADFEAYIEGWTTTDPAALDRILIRAERDVDRVVGPLPMDPTTGLKLVPANLTAAERAALARAVSAQAYYRIQRGEGTGGEQRALSSVKGPDFEVEYAETPTGAERRAAQLISPLVAQELEPLRYLRPTGARARP